MQPRTIKERHEAVRERIAAACRRSGRLPDDVTLIAVTKGQSADAVRETVAAGVRHLGENRVQEAQPKVGALADIRSELTWHMIGHLQTNKVKLALNLFAIIHSVDSLHLAEEISRRALVPVPAFLEVNVSGEPSKFGFSPDDLRRAQPTLPALHSLDVRGLMTIAPQSSDPEAARPIFRRLAELAGDLGLRQLSMGMSDDFEVAIEEGATHVRIGRVIFGERA